MNPHFNHDIKTWYSWLPKGKTSAIINQSSSNSISMIAAFCSDLEFLCSLHHSTINAEIFWNFLRVIKYSF